MSTAKTPAKLPFVIGITGHTDPVESNAKYTNGKIKNHIKNIIQDWFKFLNPSPYKNQDALTPIQLVGGLAKGIDLIAFEAATELRSGLIKEGWPEDCLYLHGILPFPYFDESGKNQQQPLNPETFPGTLLHQDYTEPGWKTRFESIVNGITTNDNDSLFQLKPLIKDEQGNSIDNWNNTPKAMEDYNSIIRKQQYLATGLLASESAHLLISCWDGLEPKAEHHKEYIGGSSDITLVQLSSQKLLEQSELTDIAKLIPSPLNGFEAGFVCHINTQRIPNERREGRFIPCNILENCFEIATLKSENPLLKSQKGWFTDNKQANRIIKSCLPDNASQHGNYLALPSSLIINPVDYSPKTQEESEQKKKQEQEANDLKSLLVEWSSCLDTLKSTNQDLAEQPEPKILLDDEVTNIFSPAFGPALDPSIKDGEKIPPLEIQSPFRRKLHSLFLYCDETAKKLQSQYRYRVLLPYFLIVASSTVIWEAYGFSGELVFLKMLFIMLSLFGLVWLYALKTKFKARYQNLRGIAELLRAKQAMNYAEVFAFDELLPRSQRRDFPTLYYLLRSASFLATCNEIHPEQAERLDNRSKVLHWLEDQNNYFKSKLDSTASIKNTKKLLLDRPAYYLRITDKLSKFAFIAAGISLLGLLVARSDLHPTITPGEPTIWWLRVSFLFWMVTIAIAKAWSEINGFKHAIENYADISWLMTCCKRALNKDKSNNEPLSENEKSMLIEVGRSALFEHLSWSEQQRKLEIERNML